MNLLLILCAVIFQVEGTPINEWALSFYDDVEDGGSRTLTGNSSIPEIAGELGVSEDFLVQLKENWEKAVETEKEKVKEFLRQGGVSGGTGSNIGEFFGLGGGGNNQGGGGDEDEDDEDEGPPMPGPDVAGVLTGLFGIFSGIGGLNPQRVIQSTVNFFPADQRVAAQMALDAAFGTNSNSSVTSLRPLTDAPPRKNDTKGTNSTATKNTAVVTVTTLVPETTKLPVPVEETTRKRLELKETSLLDDFKEFSYKLNPTGGEEKIREKPGGDKPYAPSTLEKDFADTAELFNIPEATEVGEVQAQGQVATTGGQVETLTNSTENSTRGQDETSTAVGVEVTPEVTEVPTSTATSEATTEATTTPTTAAPAIVSVKT